MKSNLFSIDEDAIVRILTEANEKLVRRRNELLRRIEKDEAGASPIDRNEAVKALRSLEKQIKKARADDGRSFRTATKTVSAFFSDLLEPVELSIERLTRLASEHSKAEFHKRLPVAVSPDGEIVCEAQSVSEPLDAFEEDWELEAFDITQLDLNHLKEFFTEYQIRMALDKHLKAYGPNRLKGVTHTKKLKAR